MKYFYSSIFFISIFLLFACGTEEVGDDISIEDKNEEPAQIPDLRVMTYNIHIGNPPAKGEDVRDLPAIAKIIKESEADLVALQEVDRYTIRSGTEVDQAKVLGEMTNMNYLFVKAREIGTGDYGTAILSKYPIIESKGYQLAPDPAVGGETRSLGIIKVEIPGKGQLIFAGTHIDHSSEDNRLFQGDRIIDILSAYNIPVILAGDFNAMPQSLTVDLFDNHFTRTCRHNCPATFPAYNPKSAIDFIMYEPSEKIKVLSNKIILKSEASDHLPVIADLKIND